MPRSTALIGAGVVGNAIGRRLLEAGHGLAVYDLDAAKVSAVAEHGARAADSAALMEIFMRPERHDHHPDQGAAR